ncbi:hypothetical protein BT69DRAFT_1334850 [Atractiella rhizophila]|nr:hypothetical protein BT69DRAFT_1334850 [Atractiella rhizophila]
MDYSNERRPQSVEERFERLHRLIGYPLDRQYDDLWRTAITHSSYSGGRQGANGGLARLGDVAMKTVQTVVIHRAGLGDDGRTLQRCLSCQPLEKICKKYGLQDLAYHNLGQPAEGFCADLVKAIIGAVYIDSVYRTWNPMNQIEGVMQRLEILDYDPQRQLDSQNQQTSRTQQDSQTQQAPRIQQACRTQRASRAQQFFQPQQASPSNMVGAPAENDDTTRARQI